MFYDYAINTQKKLKKKLEHLQKKIALLPDGKLIYSRNGKYTRWYQSDGHKSTPIPKANRHLAEQLAYKRFLKLQLTHLQHEIQAIDFYLRHHNCNADIEEQEFINSSLFHDLVSPNFKPISQELFEWSNASYEKNTLFPEHLVHKTLSGNLVRSKAEVMIDSVLFNNKMPFRYECKLALGEFVVYPDFIIRHPKTGEFFYWEHFGCLHDPKYVQRMLEKLQIYISHGIIPSVNLIITFESPGHPLTLDVIEKLVEHYFL